METRISSIVRNTFTQMNFPNSTKNPKDYVKNVEIFAPWYTQYRDIYKNSMADLPHATRITMLLREFNRSDHYLCSSYFQPTDPADLAYGKMITKLVPVIGDNSSLFNLITCRDENVQHYVGIVNRLCTGFRFDSLEGNQFRCPIFILGLRSSCNAEI
ncbi:unnamed protein product [Hymenolepis diminuta]|uniref:Uncharacterized protein n=1 Tax=Hymenolepis diminuta TaxID=6216 RepID=A0A564YER7_HYMDI|nr:unnamed protein product [Hymenolepis diminuta]